MKPRRPTDILPSFRLSASVIVAGLTVAVLWAAAATAPAQDTDSESFGMVKIGESLYRAYCTSCHGPTAVGDGPLAESLRVEPANLTLIAQGNGGEFPFEQVMKKIDGTEKVRGHGTSDMPVWGQVFTKTEDDASEEKVHDKVLSLAQYLRSLQVAEPAPGDG